MAGFFSPAIYKGGKKKSRSNVAKSQGSSVELDYSLRERENDERETMSKITGRPFDESELIAQLGKMNVWAISGGRVGVIKEEGETVGIEMPVSQGYRVVITLGWDDTWTVSRQYVRKGVASDKGTLEGVYADQVGEVAYQASCYKNVVFSESA